MTGKETAEQDGFINICIQQKEEMGVNIGFFKMFETLQLLLFWLVDVCVTLTL